MSTRQHPRLGPGRRRDVGTATWLFAQAAGRVTGTRPPAIFLTLGRNRKLFRGWLHFAGRLMPGGRLPRRDAELVILRVAHLVGSDYEWAHHETLGRRAGLSDAEIARVREGAGAEGWTRGQRLLLEVTDELHATDDLSDATWQRLQAAYDEATCIEVLMLVGHYRMLATTLGVLRVEPDAHR